MFYITALNKMKLLTVYFIALKLNKAQLKEMSTYLIQTELLPDIFHAHMIEVVTNYMDILSETHLP